jgi:hypothetical protein
MGYGRKNAGAIIHQIGDLRKFKIGNMKADWFPTPLAVPLGMLHPGYARELRSGVDMPVYVIFSYSTPIAWKYAGQQWCAPPVKYSITTSGHQSLAAHGMGRWDTKIEQVGAMIDRLRERMI